LLTIERKPDDQPTTRGERVRFELDGFGNRVLEAQERWEGGAWVEHARTEYVYSTRCYLDETIRGSGAEAATTEYAYDCNGNLERIWDANHPSNGQTNQATTEYLYDALDRLEEVRQPFGGAGGGTLVTSYQYDVQDHLTQIRDGEGTVTTYVYSDRDLMTSEISEVSGTTAYTYSPNGEQLTKTDARGITEIRTYDALDRVTFVDYPGATLDITHTYDDPAVDWSLGRLTRLERNGEAIDYRYDRFGRTTRDGALTYGYDRNGNPSTIGYPGGEMANYTHDYADREATLTVDDGSGVQSIVTAATYYPNGPLESLTLGNGLTETREHDTRYDPTRITVESSAPATLLDWTYTVDAVGNPTSIVDGLNAANNRAYGYQDYQYFLTQGDGPWGTRAWTYDTVGNRLSETADGGAADMYVYAPNTAAGNSPKLARIDLGLGGQHTFQYDPAGNQTQADLAGNVIDRTYHDANRLSLQERMAAEAASAFLYDARGFLRLATGTAPDTSGNAVFCDGFESGNTTGWGGGGSTCVATTTTSALYDSAGLLHARNDELVVYFGDDPVAQGTPGSIWLHLTPDHLGTPILATDETGSVAWQGGFEPFGSDYANASGAEVFLRFPGQWEDGAWAASGVGDEVYYNVHRWYQQETGRYARPDPVGDVLAEQAIWAPPSQDRERFSYYAYVAAAPSSFVDPLGLLKTKGCSEEETRRVKAAFEEICERINDATTGACLDCVGGVRDGLKRYCARDNRTVRCYSKPSGRCAGTTNADGETFVTCGWSIPLGRTIRLCPKGLRPTQTVCGPLGCTLAHEMTHQLGHLAEKKPREVEECLGCDP
ncbi:MAG: hypothetical protein MI919_28300, partial [Holophagales bacterium]|nr:hypothetical protein [Holophagales bacterium]